LKQEDLLKRQAIERRALPKRIRAEMKAREMMFRESMRISLTPGTQPDTPDQEREKLRKFQEQEKKRYKAEEQRCELKHRRQLEELRAAADSSIKELEQLQNEKRKMLMEHETMKLKAQDDEYQAELREWRAKLKPRKQKLEDDFASQLEEQGRFYGQYLAQAIPPLSHQELTPLQSDAESSHSRRLSSQRSTSSSVSSVSADGS
jgi:STE20-like kinase